jgi:ABC-type oligopeptide transport system substrate-binding subunit
MKLKLTAVALLLTGVLAACGTESTNEGKSIKENETQNMKELVHNYSVGNISNESASITSHQLFVKDSKGNELVYDLSGEDFFVSIAPYVNETHP